MGKSVLISKWEVLLLKWENICQNEDFIQNNKIFFHFDDKSSRFEKNTFSPMKFTSAVL